MLKNMPIHITHSIGACTKKYCVAWLRLCVSILFLTMMQSAWAMTPVDQNYDGLPVADQGSNSVTINGITYTNNAAINITIVNDGYIASGADHALAYRSFVANSSTLVSFKTSDGDEFKLNSFVVSTGIGTTTDLTIKGYKDNVEQISTNYDLSGIFFGTFNVSANANWENIDEVRISGADLDIDIDDLDFSPAITNTAPVLTNLNGDSVAWAGVGNYVSLDAGTSLGVSDVELDALNGGNGNYAGASLTLQRAGTAITTDVFGFDTSGALFSVSGSNLQSGGLTFATFTNTSGVLSINVNSSETTATKSLVQDVLQRIQYSNNTPAADAVLRYSLSDGTDSTTADVTVTSDSVYVTSTTDTATINLNNGVSFSEAVAVALADTTGSQTLILSSAFTSSMSLAGNLSIAESLAIDANAAGSSFVIAGSTLTLDSGFTLSLTHANQLQISSAINGAGNLSKTGAGSLLLTGTNTSRTGSTSVLGGTLDIDTDNNLDGANTGALILDGGTLAMSVTGGSTLNPIIRTINNPITLGAAGGTFDPTGGGGRNIVNISGVISGSGNLTKVGNSVLQLSGNNSYSGVTTVTAGGLLLAHSNGLGSTSGSTTVNAGAALRMTAGLVSPESLFLNGTGKNIDSTEYGALGADAYSLGTSTVSGNIELSTGTNISAISGSNLILSGIVSGTGTLTKMDTGSLTLAGINTYTGSTSVSEGTLVLDNSAAMANGTEVDIAAGATLRLDANETIGSLSGAGTLSMNSVNLTVNQTSDSSFSGTITGSGSDLAKSGSSKLTLSGTSTYTGSTSIRDGSLNVTGALNGTTGAIIGSGGTLEGTGSIFASSSTNTLSVQSGGILSPGVSGPGIITINGNLSIASGGALTAQIAGTVLGSDYDSVAVNGTVNVSSATLNVSHSYTPGLGDSYRLLVNDGVDSIAGNFSGLPQGGTVTAGGNGTVLNAYYAATDGGGYTGGNEFMLVAPVDITPPTVSSVTVPAGATYVGGQVLDFLVNFDESITVNTGGGTPQLALTIGATTRQATYQSGSGSSSLLFRYTIQSGEVDSDGIANGTLASNGGTLRDAAGNNANLTLNSVGSTASVFVDALAPTVSSVNVPANATYVSGQSLDFSINFDESITVNTGGGTPQLALTIGATSRQASYQSGSGTSSLLYRYTVQSGDADSDGITIGTLTSNGGTLRDAAGNNANLTLNSVGSTASVLVDAVAPAVSSVNVPANATYVSGQNLDFTINFDDSITVNTGGGTPQLALTIGATTRQAVYQSGSGTSSLLYRYTVQNGDADSDGIAIGTLASNGGTLRDAAGNNANLTLSSVGSTISVLVDAAAPTVSSVNVPANATYLAGQNLDFTVNFDESIYVNTAGGTPQLSLTIGSTTRQAAYISGTGTTALLLRYTVQSGDNDTDGIAVGTLSVNGGTLRDGAGNNATLTLSSVGSTNSVLVDALASTISSVSIPNTAHKVGDVVNATITVSADADDYTTGSGGISGTIAGYALGSLTKTNDTTYTATFTITDGGTDVAAGSNIPVNFTLTDSVGNTGSAYTTAINQNADAVYANLPGVDLTASTNTIAEDGGSSTLTATLSGSLNNQWPVDITVNLAYSGTATIATDYTKSDSITISSGSSTGTSTVTGVADTLYDAAIAETVIVDISSVSVGNEGTTNQQTISITDAESAPTVSLSVGSNTIIETGGTSTITASLSHPTYENVTVNLGYSGTATSGADYGVPSASIVVVAGSTTANAATGINSIDDANSEDSETIIIDITSVTGGGATENAVQQQTITLTDDDNVAPVITSTAVTTIDEDALYSYTFTVTDANAGDTLTLSAPTLPAWLSFTANTGVLSGTPDNDDVGPHVVKLRVNDGTIDVDQDFTITVANTNDAPTITGTPITTAVEGVAYSFTVIGADVDVGASLNYQLSNQPTWLSVNGSGVVSGTPTNSDVGTASNIVIGVSDGTETTSLPAFTIVVDADMDGDGVGNSADPDIDGDGMSNDFETANGLDPLDPSDATGDLDGDGISNLDEFINNTDPTADDYGPIISLDSNVVIDAVALLTDLPDGLASAIDALDGEVVVTHDLVSELLKPGRYTINWRAEDAAGNVTTEAQILDVLPIANWQVDQETSEGNAVTVSLYLNGEAPEYPVVADYSVLGTATNPEDHDALSGSLTITEGRRGSITLNIVSDANLETDETVIFELDSITNAVAGVKQAHTVTIGELNHPPAVALSAALDSAPAKKLNLFSTTDGMVTITATVSDVDIGDSHTFEWLGGNKLNGTVSGNTYSFDPATTGKGVYQLTVKASDDASNPKSGSAVITLTVLSESLVLSNATDSDSDGIDDLTEGFGDVDEDNVPDFADDIEASNLLAMYPIGGASSDGAWFVETQAGLSLKLNLYASGSAKYSPLLNAQQIVDENDRDRSDGGYIYDGGLFDFVVSNMPVPGQRVLVVIPQLQAIPENPVYRKLIDNTWSEYVVDANNTLQSAAGKLGVCPPPGSAEYTDGLTEGYFCVQLGIEDGGMNDADGEADGTILDPGGVGQGIPISIRSSGGSMSWPLLLLLSYLTLVFRRRQTNHLRKGE